MILMDVNMPGVEGMEALKAIVGYNPDAVVVMASSVASRQAVEMSVELGATYYIRKDSKKEEIAEVLDKVVSEIWEE